MANYGTYGYEQIRNYVTGNWNWLAIHDDTGSEVLRWDATGNPSVTEVSGPGSNPVTYEVAVEGHDITDAGGSLPVVLSAYAFYESSSGGMSVGGDSLRDSQGNVTTATLEAPNDKVVVTVNHEWPPQ